MQGIFQRLVFGFAVTGALIALAAGMPPSALILLGPSKPASAVPPGWQIKVTSGSPDIAPIDADDEAFLHFRSKNSSFGIERSLDVDPAQSPWLDWRWKVTQLPRNGDFRHYSTDDQAAQVMVAFADHKIITYLWDTSAPAGTMASASSIPLVHIFAFVCRSGSTDLNNWLEETRNIAADYAKAYGKPAPHVKGLRLQINSQHTGSSAESYFGAVVFRNTQS